LRTLWIKPGGFLPLDSGGKIRSFHTVKALAKYWPTTVITYYPEEKHDQNGQLAEFVEKLITIPLPPRSRPSIYLSSVLHSRPFSFEKFCHPKVVLAVESELQRTKYDIIICDFLLGCGVVPFESQIPKVVFTHNVECRIWERHYKVADSLPKRILAKREWQSLAETERKYLSAADAILAVSDADGAEFVSWGIPSHKVRSVPTGVDTSYFAPRTQKTAAPTLVFTGSMDWMPNQDGILWFLDEIYPTIQAQVPNVKLRVVGRKPPQSILDACAKYPGVTATGWVDDIRDYLADSDVCIVPLRVGSGTRLKIFEAMAMGKAIVSTTIGAEGLPVSNQIDIVLADTSADYAAAVLELLHNDSKVRQIGLAARQLVENRYSWEAVTVDFIRAIEAGLHHESSGASALR
jgi:glycosyltransferase involved in cell wall biosynthesis